MPVKSYLNGQYRLVAAVESSSRANSWYRVLRETTTGQLSCDCPAWIMNQRGDRTCKHTEAGARLLTPPQGTRVAAAEAAQRAEAARRAAEGHPLIEATTRQWPALASGTWAIEELTQRIGSDPYQLVLVRLRTGDQVGASAVVAFANRHFRAGERYPRMVPGVAGWAGYELCSQLARAAGFPLVGRPPDHFSMPRRARGRGMAEPEYGLADLLRVGERTDLGDGLTPIQRAEATLQLFLGPLYEQLETRGFLDVPSLHASQRVYRIRRDAARRRERRVRVIQDGRYTNDLCLVRAQDVPEADHLLTIFLRLCSDEQGLLALLRGQHAIGQPYATSGNVFAPHSEDYDARPRAQAAGPCRCEGQGHQCPCRQPRRRGDLETEPALWRPRAMAEVA